MIAQQLREIIAQAANTTPDKVHLEHPELSEHGDFSTNIALATKINAKDLATKIKGEMIAKVEVAGPGFINIWLKEESLIQSLPNSSDLPKDSLSNQKIMLEYGQPNTHKMPHVGHLFSYIYGESVARLLTAAGATVRRVNYQGDVGLHVAKCLWAYQKHNGETPKTLEDKVRWLQKLYQEGSAAYDQDELAKTEINQINKKIYIKDPEIMTAWQETRDWSEKYYQQFEARLGIHYDHNYWENQIAAVGKQLVEDNIGKVFKKSDGAVVFDGAHTRVFITSEGNPTYEAKDLALERQKMLDWPCDLLIITTASEQNAYFDVVFDALCTLDSKLKGKLMHIGFGLVNLKSGKMSSRTGNIIGAVDLVDMVVKEASQIKSEAAEQVGLGAIKYAFLKKGAIMNMEFDLESSISLEGNSGPYLQYTYARTQSLLRKSQATSSKSQEKLNPEELAILRFIYRYPEVVAEAAGRYAPNLLTNFLYELARKFNTFYNSHQILGYSLRLDLTKYTGEVLQSGLNLLGIEALESM